MANEFGRSIQDANLTKTKALPAAAATNTSDSIDLGTTGYKPENIEVEVNVPAMAAHVTVNDTTLTLHDSADDSTFAETVPMIQIKVPGVAGTGSVAILSRYRLPPNTRKFIRWSQTAGATDNLTGTSITYKLLV